VRARAPASTSNLGPGFDVLGLALALYVEVEVVDAPRLVVRSTGEGADLAQDASHLAAKVATAVRGHDRLAITVKSSIPVGRGLGSSAALAVAAAAAAGSSDPLLVAAGVDGHGENAAASVHGGLVAAPLVDGMPVVRRFALDPDLGFVLLVPERQLPTAEARAALPATVPFRDAVANLGRLALLLAGLGDAALLERAAGEDRLHQGARSRLFPEAPRLLGALEDAGAVVACWSGAGTSLLGICRSTAAVAGVREAGEEALARAGVAGRAIALLPDLEGLLVEG
jgi:homoserine kinase